MTRRVVSELVFSEEVEDKLAAHSVDALDVLDVLDEGPRFFRDKVDGRDLMIGKTPDGRVLTIVVEREEDGGTTYTVVTGWEASKAERKAWERAK